MQRRIVGNVVGWSWSAAGLFVFCWLLCGLCVQICETRTSSVGPLRSNKEPLSSAGEPSGSADGCGKILRFLWEMLMFLGWFWWRRSLGWTEAIVAGRTANCSSFHSALVCSSLPSLVLFDQKTRPNHKTTIIPLIHSAKIKELRGFTS